MNKFIHWPVWVILAALLIVAVVPAIAIVHSGKTSAAHAAGATSSITVPAILHPFDTVTITGQGFAPYDNVQIALANTNNPVGGLTCDSNGNCSGQITIKIGWPYESLAQGAYSVFATGRTGVTAQASIMFLPGVALFVPNSGIPTNMISGGPGTAMQLEGGAFNFNEVLNLYFGTKNPISLGSVTATNGSFSQQINAPATIAPGFYQVNVVRTAQTPATVSTPFTILPPRIVSSAGVREGQAALVHLSGFAAKEQVMLSWNANGGQTITTVTMDSTGALNTAIAPPSAPKGAYILQALGNTSQLHAQSNLALGPGILLSLNTENPGGTTTVEGGGFTPGESINVYFQRTSNGVTTTTADAAGSFNVSLAIPTKYIKNTPYFVYAVSTTTSDTARAQFFFTAPAISLACCNNPVYGSSFTLDGQGFAALEMVKITAQSTAQAFPFVLGTVSAAADGTFTFTSTVPSGPYVPSVVNGINMYMNATGLTSKLKASMSFDAPPNIIPTPTSGQIGQSVVLLGGGFGSNETVTIQFQNTAIATAKTNSTGAFKATIIVPATAQAIQSGCEICANGNTSGASVSVAFTVVPTITMSPQSGPSATKITVNGTGLYMYDGISIYWFNPATNTQT
ncbi:MAG TPA: hypothetical protein VFQ36_03090, partial [Ktedonobacteraceae bacterium]|nr:hypothetical protein [Ktedonobacteraceae bacterium]